jgi:Nitrile hydratase, alpha chain
MLQEQRSQAAERYARVVAKAWADPAFKQRLVADPLAVLQEHGLPVPAGLAARVVENTTDTVYLVLPARPRGELSAKEVGRVTGEETEPAKKLGHVLIKALQDEAFKRRLVADPRAVLQEEGVPLPEGKTVRVVEDTPQSVHVILPRKPAAEELSEDQLGQVAGGLVGEVHGAYESLQQLAIWGGILFGGYEIDWGWVFDPWG